ncbi:hypothetical protein, partial [Bacillus smithii]|uniref:hypothetical protein n=1 Tax=Bacillus smithii TaxID=1479 RepID=UPI002E1E6A44|nr:hypothetical protein [Bacillus smithii]
WSSDRKFAARFLQIPRHHGHPCVKLTATSAFAAWDFHPIDYTHAGRTQESRSRKKHERLSLPGYFILFDAADVKR